MSITPAPLNDLTERLRCGSDGRPASSLLHVLRVFCAVVSAACVSPIDSAEADKLSVPGAEPVAPEQWSSALTILDARFPAQRWCSAAKVSERHVVTLGHCVANVEVTWGIFANTVVRPELESGQTLFLQDHVPAADTLGYFLRMNIVETHVHDSYDETCQSETERDDCTDLALIEVEPFGEAERIRWDALSIARLDEAIPTADEEVTRVGGLCNADVALVHSPTLFEAPTTIIAVQPNIIIVPDGEPGATGCGGDSGAPFYRSNSDPDTVVGLAIGPVMMPDGFGRRVRRYAYLRTQSYADWLSSHLGEI